MEECLTLEGNGRGEPIFFFFLSLPSSFLVLQGTPAPAEGLPEDWTREELGSPAGSRLYLEVPTLRPRCGENKTVNHVTYVACPKVVKCYGEK